MKSQVTTKKGDLGTSRTLAGEIVSKHHPIMECVGCLDELRAQTALLRLQILELAPQDAEQHAAALLWLLHAYFSIGATCSDPQNAHPEYRKADLQTRHVERLEAEQLRLESVTRLPKAFIVSAANALAAQADIVCTVARRLERQMSALRAAEPAFDAPATFAFVNRLSDYFFILARQLEGNAHHTVDYGQLGS